MLQPWQQELLQDNLEARSPMTPEDLLDAIDWRGISVSELVTSFRSPMSVSPHTTALAQFNITIFRSFNDIDYPRVRVRLGRSTTP